jgi:hypothetical protein
MLYYFSMQLFAVYYQLLVRTVPVGDLIVLYSV